ncbi:unnamed protein product [Citrullus colocynthis]|uniref:DUF7054 domain-containing protein n=1 Tax=Citrullus colocynthis TaxID=252529 RepID=A0ABP0XS99_9ROSI
MSSSSFRRRIPAISSTKNNKPRHNLSPSPRRRTPPTNRALSNKPSILTRSSSEPNLWTTAAAADPTVSSEKEGEEVVIFRPHTFSEAFASSPLLIPSPSPFLQGYKKDAKVVINVTVEGSPGPVRTMVKLGSSVDDTIKLVVAKYGEEGRTPKLEPTGSPSSFELHHSYFSLHSLDRREIIGEIGSRSFYLRKTHSSHGKNEGESSTASAQRSTKETRDVALPIPPGFLISSFIARKMSKIVRRTRKLWNFIVCLR